MLEQKTFSRYRKPMIEIPNLVEHHLNSYDNFIKNKIKEVFSELSPISDYSEKKYDIIFKSFKIIENDSGEYDAKEQNRGTYFVSVKATFALLNKTTGEEKEEEIFMFNLPKMTDHGTFVVNGVERVIIPQLARSYGIFFTVDETKVRRNFGAKIIPARGSWIEIESDSNDIIYVKLDRKRKMPISSLLRIFAPNKKDEEIINSFEDENVREYMEKTFKKDPALNLDDSYLEIYKRLRDGEMVTSQVSKNYIDTLFTEDRYDLSEIGRIRFNSRFFSEEKTNYSKKEKTLEFRDFSEIIKKIVSLNNDIDAQPDDIDNLGSRRLRFFDELIEQRFRMGMLQIKRNIQDRMSIVDTTETNPSHFINPRPIEAKIKEFFNTNPLSQFMDQDNMLSELENLRTVSALGPGGLVRERAGFEVRDVHPSHYGRVCPIQTPEGQNIGLILRLSTYAKVNKYGIIQTPYAKVKNGKVTKEIVYLDAYEEAKFAIAHYAAEVDEKTGEIKEKIIEVRKGSEPVKVSKNEVEFIDISHYQIFSIATSMIPFVGHNEANRALMGSNMQRQAVPCINPEAPIVATGIEEKAARYTGRNLYAEDEGEIVFVDGEKIEIKHKTKTKKHKLINFSRTNNFSLSHQRPSVKMGQKVRKGELLADNTSSANGQISVGKNMLVAFMSFYGSNYEDAIVISERVVKKSKFTNIYIKEYIVDIRDTKLGPEQTTHDIPNVSEAKIKNLDEEGIIRVGSEVSKGDILVGKITPKGESQLTPEERLLRSIFGEKAREVKDTSLKLKAGEKGRVISVKTYDRSSGDELESGVIKKIYIHVAELRNIKVGDKMAGRYGNKGVVSVILPEEDMPYTKDGEPIDVVLSPLGVPSRMNLGQILEVHLGLAANTLNYQAIVPPFSSATDEEIKTELKKAGFSESGKIKLYDGLTGEAFSQDVTVGYMYILKLHHMIDDKMHVRSTGPYSLINQQPLGGKAQEGGQRFGEMEVWALLGHGAAYALREILTVKSDDILGRAAMYDSIVKGENFILPNTPESFNVMLSTLRGLSLSIEMGENEYDD